MKTNKVKKAKHQNKIRLIIQVLAAALFNGYAIGFAKGKIFTGNTKAVCVPVLNCYSCPAAIGACPIGALQAVLGGNKHNFSFYVVGTLMLFGIVFGRVICGFLCPFGLVQDLLHKVPVPKIKVPKKIDNLLRYLKYVILIVFVILLPTFMTNAFGIATPYFCKWICPVGVLEGAFPLLSQSESLRKSIGFLFDWKLTVLIVILLFSTIINRPFCKYICPLGAFYGLFNRFSFYQLNLEKVKCTNCKKCNTTCPMNIDVTKNILSNECIRCGKCKEICPTNAISTGFGIKKITINNERITNKKIKID